MERTREIAFEHALTETLIAGGFEQVPSKTYNRELAIFPALALEFIRSTQIDQWNKLEALHGDKTGERVLHDLCKWMDTHGVLPTFRHGFKCFGRTLRIAFFKPAHGMNPDLHAKFMSNHLGVTRQLHYTDKSENSIDVVLSINGIPVCTLELKNPMTGQTAEDAMAQYRRDRDPRDRLFEFKKRALVHFAVDTEVVHMTTRLAGTATQFLPFNLGWNDGAGNPADAEGRTYKTAYLWEDVLNRDSLLDLIARLMHLQIEEIQGKDGKTATKETMIFPRYHQLDALRKLVSTSALEGPGHNYLIEHAAGSGKSNTIGWLAHRLCSLHNAQDQRLFESVIVVTDRLVLDKQLQNTIYQFEHRQGVVQKIDKDSKQLAEALDNATPIIITTLQKFPFVTKQLQQLGESKGHGSAHLPPRNYAVIVDEAHSSQSGETATDLREVLGGELLQSKAAEQASAEGLTQYDELFRSMAKRGKQMNVSFFAFTATPKHKTLAIFGRHGQPFHRYTMKQSIEEGFIMDVLLNYTTYKTYYKLLKSSNYDPNVERKKAAKALARFMRLHPHNISQKTEIMVEHFNTMTRHKIGGHAKAMVLTGSRLEAVHYKLSFDRYINDKGYPIRTLVAFSGSVTDDKIPEKTYTEEGMNNGIREKQLPEEFSTNEYQVLLVADKYQTGFDQPLLHTMYVDKRLAGIQAVQALSRLNRTHPLKEDTFILDFVNGRDEIQEAFKQFYEGAIMGEEVAPDRLYELKADLDASGIYFETEVNNFCEVYFKPKERQSIADHRAINVALDPAVDRFRNLHSDDADEAELWRAKLYSFRNLYVFLSQIIPYQDSELEKLYTFIRHLASKLPKRASGPNYQFDDDVRLEYYRLQKISEGSISLKEGKAYPLDGPKEVGTGIVREDKLPFSRLIDLVNERFGTAFTEADQLFFDQIVEEAIRDEGLRQAAQVNPIEKFQLLFRQVLESLFIDRMEMNEDIFVKFMNDREFQEIVTKRLGQQVYNRLPKDADQLSSS
jgi:type I restriction enzyme R subunit